MSDPQQETGARGSGRDLTQGSIAARLFSMAGPMFIGLFALISVNVVDTFFVGQLGTLPLAAMGFCFPIVFLATELTAGLSAAVQSIVSRAVGEEDEEKAKRITTHALLLTVALVAVLVILGLTYLEPIFRLLGAGDSTLPFIEKYMRVWFVSLFFYAIPLVAGAAMMARGDATRPMFIMIGGSVLNAVFDPLLIFGLGPFPHLGIEGAALASAFARILVTIGTLMILVRNGQLLPLGSGLFDDFLSSSKELLGIGVPATGTNIIAPISMAILTRFVADFGAPAVAAYGAGTRIQALASLVFIALGIALIPIIGQNWGAGLKKRARQAVALAEKSSIGWALVSWGLLALGSTWLANAFVEGEAAAEHLALFLLIVPAGLIGEGLFSIAKSSLNAIDRPLPAVVISVARTFILTIPLAWLGSHFFGLLGVFGSIPVTTCITGLVSAVVTRRLVREPPV